ncbi:nickel ABC transporter substrate-binding protein [Deferribacteres bacterium DY0037]
MFKKVLLSIALILSSFMFSFAGQKDTLVTAWPVNVGAGNPHLYTPNQMFAQVMIYDALVRYDGKDIEPSLAESWEISPDGLTYTFYLRNGVTFSDGTTFNAEAVAMNFQAIMANASRHGWLALVSMIESWEAKNDQTFVMHLKRPYSLTLQELSLPRPFRILAPSGFIDNEAETSKGIKKPIGTGPWVLKETRLGQYDLFVRNESYWGAKPEYSKLLVKVLPDPHSRVVALETGEVDILLGDGSFTLENFVRLQKNPQFVTAKSGSRNTNMLALNSNRGATKELNVRRAIMHAVNKDAIVKYILLDLEKRADTLYSESLQYCGLGLQPYGYDKAKSVQLLEDAGWKLKGTYREKGGMTLSLDLHYIGTDPKQKALAEAIQADLLKVGIKINLRAEENTIFYSLQANGNFDMIFNKTWGPPFEPGSFTASMRKPSHADYQAQAGLSEKAEIDDNISKLLVSTDEADIKKRYRYVLSTLHKEAVYLPISYGLDLAVYNKNRISNFEFGEMTTEFMFHKMSVSE